MWGGSDAGDTEVASNEVTLEREEIEDDERGSLRCLQASCCLLLQGNQPLRIRRKLLEKKENKDYSGAPVDGHP